MACNLHRALRIPPNSLNCDLSDRNRAYRAAGNGSRVEPLAKNAVMLALFLETVSFFGMAGTNSLWLLYLSAAAFGFAYGGGVVVFPPLVRTTSGAPMRLIVGRSRQQDYGSDWPIYSTGTARCLG